MDRGLEMHSGRVCRQVVLYWIRPVKVALALIIHIAFPRPYTREKVMTCLCKHNAKGRTARTHQKPALRPFVVI